MKTENKKRIPWNKGNDNRLIGKCKQCSKEFRFQYGHTVGMFCSRECYNKNVAIPPKNCMICGKLYTPDRGSQNKWEKSKYCSLQCLNQSKFRGQNVECYTCKRQVWKTPYQLKKSKKYFCSKKCFNKYQSTQVTTTKNYAKGRRAEYECMDILRGAGYYCFRSYRSLGPFDVMACNENITKFIQVKATKYPKFNYQKDIIQNASILLPERCIKELWIKVLRDQWYCYIIQDDGSIKEIDMPQPITVPIDFKNKANVHTVFFTDKKDLEDKAERILRKKNSATIFAISIPQIKIGGKRSD